MQNFPKLENKILTFWKKNKIFQKSVKQRPKTRQFVFYEGPPTANGKPGLHHILARSFKDIICRYKTMQGFRVERRAGWDTHGLPVELEVEKELGLRSKKDIEKYGISEFNKQCRDSVWKYKRHWEQMTERIGFWLDMENPYITYSPEYISSVWHILKKVWQKNLLYQGYKVAPYCSRCGTSLSSHEVAQGYKKVKEKAVYVKLKIQNSKQAQNPWTRSRLPGGLQSKTYFLTWTTTPWTLPGNAALAVNSKLDYVLAEVNSEEFILAKDRLEILGEDYKIKKEFKGRDLVGSEYEPLFNIKELQNSSSHKVYSADFVTANEGSGIVHTAVMYGVDDYELGKKHNLPQKHTVDKNGKFNSLVQGFESQFVKSKETEKNLINYLAKNNALFKQELYEHDYPFCWRCKKPLLYYAKNSWFIKMTALKEQMIKNNKKINWIPSHLQEGRFGEWLREIKDWALSRERYWGTPLPIWQCQMGKSKIQNPKFKTNLKSKITNSKQCGNIKVIGSVKELEKLSGKKIKDAHRPGIDKIIFKCEKCSGTMKRVSEVIDCWFDAGAMPFAQGRWPFAQMKNEKGKKKSYDTALKPPELFPADYISEAIDQTRGWFYTLLAISTLLGFGPSYKNVISLGHLLDEKGEKMSKSRGNVIDPWLVLDKYGADAARWFFFTVNQPGDSKQVSVKDIETTLKKFLMIFWNCYVFFETYTKNEKLKVKKEKLQLKIKNSYDRWAISKLNTLIKDVSVSLDVYDVTLAARKIEEFIIEDFSQWYVRRSRKRFQHPKSKQELKGAADVMGFVLLTLSKLTAPFAPFLSEEFYQKLRNPKMSKSVHLDSWPVADEKAINKKLEDEMTERREIISEALAERAKLGIKIRQPLRVVTLKEPKSFKMIGITDTASIIAEEVNLEVDLQKVPFGKITKLNKEITPELKEKGMIREVIRHIQSMRKKFGFTPNDKILIQYSASRNLKEILEKNKELILKKTRAKGFEQTEKPASDYKQVEIEKEKLELNIKKI